MSAKISAEGRKIIEVLKGFPEYRNISDIPVKNLNSSINAAIKALSVRKTKKAKEAVSRILDLNNQKIYREAEERGTFIGFDPYFD